MKRWNGWGEESINSHLSPAAAAFVKHAIGTGSPAQDAPLEEVVAQVPPTRLPAHPLTDLAGAPNREVRDATSSREK